MTRTSLNLTRFMTAVLAFALCGGPELMAQTPVTIGGQQPQAADQTQNVGTTPQSATPDPSKGPLQPSDQPLPDAPSAQQDQQPPAQPAPQPKKEEQQSKEAPLGAAAAQAGKTAGGAASKPAGTAIAPAKQHQTRSLLIKVGAIAAGAVAIGTIYALSRSSPGVPPGATTANGSTGH